MNNAGVVVFGKVELLFTIFAFSVFGKAHAFAVGLCAFAKTEHPQSSMHARKADMVLSSFFTRCLTKLDVTLPDSIFYATTAFSCFYAKSMGRSR